MLVARALRKLVSQYKAENRIKIRRQVRIRRSDFTLQCSENFAIGNFPARRIEEEVWDGSDLIAFESSVLMNLEEYKSLASALEAATPTLASSLEYFIRVMAYRSYEGLSDEDLAKDVVDFGSELDQLPIRVQLTAFVDGISISDSPLVISDWLTLRRPVAEDMAEYLTLDEVGGFSWPKGQTFFRIVGEFSYDVAGTGVAQNNFIRVMEALRLFRLGGVVSNRYSMTAKQSFLNRGISTLGGTGHSPSRYSYTLSPSDSAALKQFVEDIVPLLSGSGSPATTAKGIAKARYDEAVFQNGPSEQIITIAVTALEALFLNNEGELRHRLAQRVSIFLRLLGSQPDGQNAYTTVSTGYVIRSKFIHGSYLKPKDQPEANRIAPMLLEYARACVLAFFQLRIAKDDLLQQLDRAMVDPPSVPKLEAQLASVRHK